MSADEPTTGSSTTSATRSRPTARAVWDGAIAATGVAGEGAARRRRQLRRARGDGRRAWTSSASPRCCCPPATSARHGTLDPYDFEHVAARWEEIEKLAGALARPVRRARARRPASAAWRGVREMRARLRRPVGRRAATCTRTASTAASTTPTTTRSTRSCAELGRAGRDAGRHVGRADAERVRPPDRHRPRRALLPRHRASCSRTSGWPWVDEAIAMALKFPNVYLGTGAYPPRHWPPAVLRRSCAARAAPRSCSAPTSRPSATATRSTRSPSSGSTPRSSRRCSAAPRGGVHPPRGRRSRA